MNKRLGATQVSVVIGGNVSYEIRRRIFAEITIADFQNSHKPFYKEAAFKRLTKPFVRSDLKRASPSRIPGVQCPRALRSFAVCNEVFRGRVAPIWER